MENNEVVQLYLDDIIPNRFQPREVFDDQALKELAISIREHGVIQPILVRKFGEKYEIIAGERRYKASTMAGLTKIPAIVKNLDDKESSKVALIENLQRRDLTPIEEARTYQKILDLDEMTQEQLAMTMGKSQSAVSNKLRLLSLPDEIQEALLREEISERHARSLLNVEDKNVQIDLLKEIVASKMTVRELDSRIKRLSESSSDNTSSDVSGGSNNTLAKDNKDINEVEDLFGAVNSSVSNNNSLFEVKEDNNNEKSLSELAQEADRLIAQHNANSSGSLGSGSPIIEEKPTSSLFGDNNEKSLSELAQEADRLIAQHNTNSSEPLGSGLPIVEEKPTSSLFGDNNEKSLSELAQEADRLIAQHNTNSSEPLGSGSPIVEEKPTSSLFDNNNEKSLSELAQEADKLIAQHNASSSGTLGNSSLFMDENRIKEDSTKSDSLFSMPNVDSLNNNDSLFGSSTQNEVATDSVISVNNIRTAVNEVRDVIKSYKDKGYSVTVEELDLDNEVQLIVKFNKS